ncbi:MAG: hypothetical protein Kow006_19640 [Gammaproteobacteria bacterium]
MRILIGFLTALIGGNALAASQDELLPPDVAFVVEVRAIDANTLRARWIIADGYFLYREKISFSTTTPGYRIGEIRFPPGKIKDDPYFGRTETYRHQIMVDIPLQRDAGAPATLTLVARSQGCADLGVCYPPQSRNISIRLPQESRSEKPLSLSTVTVAGR